MKFHVPDTQMSYTEACDLVQALRDEGINANTTVAGVDIFPKEDQVEKMKEITKEHGRTPEEETSDMDKIRATRPK